MRLSVLIKALFIAGLIQAAFPRDFEDIQTPFGKGSTKDDILRTDAQMRNGFQVTIWPDGKIPYEIHGSLQGSVRMSIQRAINDYKMYTCIRLVPKSRFDKNYVIMHKGSGCSSYVGMIGGAQKLSIGNGCNNKGIIIHEIGHALGMFHEQGRSDRDKYVRIIWKNIVKGMEGNFEKENYNPGTQYDFSSVMHYFRNAFSINGQDTIVTLNPDYQDLIGQQSELSDIDKQRVKKMYCSGGSGGSGGSGKCLMLTKKSMKMSIKPCINQGVSCDICITDQKECVYGDSNNKANIKVTDEESKKEKKKALREVKGKLGLMACVVRKQP